MERTNEQREQFLKKLAKEAYPYGDDFYAHRSKKHLWHFGYVNDYPLQHGKGKNIVLPESMVNTLMNRIKL